MNTVLAHPYPPAVKPQPILLEGEQLGLGTFDAQHAELYWRWEQEPDVMAGLGHQTPTTREVRLADYEAQARRMDTASRFTIYDMAAGEPCPVGYTTLLIDHHRRTAEYLIILGAEGRGRGLGVEATELTLDWAFRICALRTVWLYVLEPHTAAITTYQRAGFTETGRRPNCGYWYGQPTDEILMCAEADMTAPVAVTPLGGDRG
ncbi:N-acetyltransferase [Pseudonocardiaceae bacterium YIM PH 21723]|nr:N-acetyltransferase [Pseudonocardiaceae bacterium YIM PH 21723]